MNYSATLPYFLDPEETVVSVVWDHPELGPIPFGASPNDPVAHGREIHAAAMAGEYGPIISYARSHWYSTADNNVWGGKTYSSGQLIISRTGEQPPNTASQKPAPVELTPAEKLAKAGLTVDELKALLA